MRPQRPIDQRKSGTEVFLPADRSFLDRSWPLVAFEKADVRPVSRRVASPRSASQQQRESRGNPGAAVRPRRSASSERAAGVVASSARARIVDAHAGPGFSVVFRRGAGRAAAAATRVTAHPIRAVTARALHVELARGAEFARFCGPARAICACDFEFRATAFARSATPIATDTVLTIAARALAMSWVKKARSRPAPTSMRSM
jgi:hypothetical protein